jgi:adenylyltransferase/sulfurtransferase
MNKKDTTPIEILGEERFDEDRFDRQKRIKGWDQNKIFNATVMVIGAGATGNEVVKNLAMVGIGKIILIDNDRANTSNLNRCVLFSLEEPPKEMFKVEIVQKASKKLNPASKLIPIKTDLNSIDKTIYKECDVICSCVDNLEARIEANNYAVFNQIPFVDSGIDEFFGSVQCVYSKVSNSACLHCGITGRDLNLMWRRFSCTGQELAENEQETNLRIASIITTTSIIGGIQSQQVLKFLLGMEDFEKTNHWNQDVGEPLVGKQLIYNGLKNKFTIIKKQKDPECWSCSSKTVT